MKGLNQSPGFMGLGNILAIFGFFKAKLLHLNRQARNKTALIAWNTFSLDQDSMGYILLGTMLHML